MPIKFSDKYSGLTYEDVRRLFDYSFDTGELFHLVRYSNKIKVGSVAGNKRTTKSGSRRIHIGINYRIYLARRIIWLWVTGEWPEDEIDHEDGDGWNNKWLNLRDATHLQNLKNQKKRSNNTSGFTGMVWDKNRKKFLAKIRVNYKIINLGRFTDIQEAVAVRKAAEQVYFGEFTRK